MDSRVSDIQTRRIIEEQKGTIRLLTDLTRAGSWVIRYSTEGRITSAQWGNGFRRLMGYTDQSDFPDETAYSWRASIRRNGMRLSGG